MVHVGVDLHKRTSQIAVLTEDGGAVDVTADAVQRVQNGYRNDEGVSGGHR